MRINFEFPALHGSRARQGDALGKRQNASELCTIWLIGNNRLHTFFAPRGVDVALREVREPAAGRFDAVP